MTTNVQKLPNRHRTWPRFKCSACYCIKEQHSNVHFKSTAGTVPHSWDHYQCPSQLGPLPMSLTAGTITNVPHSWDHYQCPSQLGPLPMSLTAGTITNVSNSWDHYQCPQWYRMQKVCKEGGGRIKKEVDI